MLKFSIITICYNSEAVISKTIESVLAQKYPEVEYLIIDGASTDKTLKIAESYRQQFEEKGYQYLIFSESDKGIYDAMNKGIRKSTGDIIGIINSGDWYEDSALVTVAETYSVTHFDVFYADINIIKNNGKVIIKHSKHDFFPSSRHWNHPTTFVLKNIYNELGMFRCEGIHDDFEFLLRVRRAHKKIVIKNIVLANFTLGGTSNSRSLKKSFARIKDRYRAYRLNRYSPFFIIECLGIEIVKAIIE